MIHNAIDIICSDSIVKNAAAFNEFPVASFVLELNARSGKIFPERNSPLKVSWKENWEMSKNWNLFET